MLRVSHTLKTMKMSSLWLISLHPLRRWEFQNLFAATHTAFFGGPAGWTGDWHVSASRNLFVVISGEWQVEASDGTKRLFVAKSVLLAEDTTGKGHRSRVVSKEDSLALLVELAD
jgi:hypothetical protein